MQAVAASILFFAFALLAGLSPRWERENPPGHLMFKYTAASVFFFLSVYFIIVAK